MKAHASDAGHESSVAEARLYHRQSLIVSLPSQTRIVVAKGAVQLAFADHSLNWLGEAAPAIRITLYEGDTYVVERSCHATLYGAQAGMSALHLEAAVSPPPFARLRAWFARRVLMRIADNQPRL